MTFEKMRMRQHRKIFHQIFATTGWPALIFTFYFFDLILLNALKLLLIGWFGIFIILPLVFKFSYSLQRGLLFLNFISYPSNLDLTRPETLGLFATRHFHLNYNDDDDDNVDKQEEDGAKRQVSIASWHSLPHHISKRFYKQLQLSAEIVKNISNEDNVHNDANDPAEHSYKVIEKLLPENFDIEKYEHKRIMFEEILRKTKDPIVLYLHGNTGTRANGHRIELYRILQRLGYHVIAMDYRGFADSSDISPTEPGCVSDALSMYRYIKNITNNPLFVYGHSLGTGIALHMISIISKSNIENPKGVILEAPFNNIREEVIKHPFSWLFRNLPWFESTILKPIYDNGFRFESDQHISEFRSPVLIMHAENDRVVPYELGYKLYRKALESRGKSWGPVEFHRFEQKFGHKFIVRAKNLPAVLEQFINKYKSEDY